jgi:hypothetical protein
LQELTYIIKQDIAALNSQIAQLQAFTQSNLNAGAGGKQVSEHNKNVVTMLQTKLADTTIGFKDVLEIRTQVSVPRCGPLCVFSRTGPFLWATASDSCGPAHRCSPRLSLTEHESFA